jgi:hypothetical protein
MNSFLNSRSLNYLIITNGNVFAAFGKFRAIRIEQQWQVVELWVLPAKCLVQDHVLWRGIEPLFAPTCENAQKNAQLQIRKLKEHSNKKSESRDHFKITRNSKIDEIQKKYRMTCVIFIR